MKFLKIEQDGMVFTFFCESRNTRSGFAHDCRLFINGNCMHTSHAYYLNRTWESWSFQTVCLSALREEMALTRAVLRRNFMGERGYTRMTATRAKEFAEILMLDERMKTLRAVADRLNKVCYLVPVEYAALRNAS